MPAIRSRYSRSNFTCSLHKRLAHTAYPFCFKSGFAAYPADVHLAWDEDPSVSHAPEGLSEKGEKFGLTASTLRKRILMRVERGLHFVRAEGGQVQASEPRPCLSRDHAAPGRRAMRP
jgi:hypothetical protein